MTSTTHPTVEVPISNDRETAGESMSRSRGSRTIRRYPVDLDALSPLARRFVEAWIATYGHVLVESDQTRAEILRSGQWAPFEPVNVDGYIICRIADGYGRRSAGGVYADPWIGPAANAEAQIAFLGAWAQKPLRQTYVPPRFQAHETVEQYFERCAYHVVAMGWHVVTR